MENRNTLYPIFLKVENLNFLIVGGGEVASEKLTFLLKSSPQAFVKVIASDFRNSVIELAKRHQNVLLVKEDYNIHHLDQIDIVIVAIDDPSVRHVIRVHARTRRLLVNVADKPEECDFYLGSIVTKGELKIAVSTNGKSPTMAKRIRQWLEDTLPNDVNDLILNLNRYRNSFDSFGDRVKNLNALTQTLLKKESVK